VLKLTIQNFDRLPDGGPLSFQAERRGFDFGRDQHLDWTLPDKSRFISGKHCEVRYYDGHYWLNDVSTNGTFVNQSQRRVQNPYRLANGDELQVGDYIVRVEITEPVQERPVTPAAAAPERAASTGNLWETGGSTPAPINPQDLMPPVKRGVRAADFLSSVASVPAPLVTHPPEAAPRQPAAPSPNLWAATGVGGAVPPRPAPEVYPQEPPFPATPMRWPGQAAPAVPETAAKPAPDSGLAELDQEFIRQFARGAGIPEDFLAGRKAPELALEMGQFMRIICSNLMQLLMARAAAKTLARSGHRTLIQARDNNPLKLSPSPEEAMRIMLGKKSESYLDARQTLERSFADLKAHQLATLAAMQGAFAQLIDELSPEAIEKAGGKAKLLGTSKGALWDMFRERWRAKSAHHENGMLDAFIILFGQLYENETRKNR
jgi:type VI secretion system protein ImpI